MKEMRSTSTRISLSGACLPYQIWEPSLNSIYFAGSKMLKDFEKIFKVVVMRFGQSWTQSRGIAGVQVVACLEDKRHWSHLCITYFTHRSMKCPLGKLRTSEKVCIYLHLPDLSRGMLTVAFGSSSVRNFGHWLKRRIRDFHGIAL